LISSQPANTLSEFNSRVATVKLEFAEKCGLNVCLYWENVAADDYTKMVPTSAVTGDGEGHLINV
jgi:translation initiation factor IF-2